MNIASIVGVTTGVVSLLGTIYMMGYWKGGVDIKIKAQEDQLCKYPPGEIALMCKTMWNIYVVDVLHQRPDLAQHNSPYKLTPKARDLIPSSVKLLLDDIHIKDEDQESVASGWLVVKHLGLPIIEQMAQEKSLTVQESIAILSTYISNSNRSNNHR